MKTKLFCVYDSKAECYGTPFFMPTRGMAERAFGNLVNDPQSSIHRNPEDFTLYEVGEFDDSTGVVNATLPVNLGIALKFIFRKMDGAPATAAPAVPSDGGSKNGSVRVPLRDMHVSVLEREDGHDGKSE